MKPDSAAALAVPDVGSEVDLEKVTPRNRSQTGEAKVGQTKADYASPCLPFEQVEGKIVRDGRGQFLRRKRPMKEKKVFPVLSHEGLEKRRDHRSLWDGGKSSSSFCLR